MRVVSCVLILLVVGSLAAAPAGARGITAPPNAAKVVPADPRAAKVFHGAPVGFAKVDSFYIMGGVGRLSGKFQKADGVTGDMQGWTGVDLTARTNAKWNVSTWNGRVQLDTNYNPNHTMWCGEMLPPCPGGDPAQGYTNGYDEWLDWYGTVANNTVSTSVTVTCILNNDSEPGYDFLRFEVARSTGQEELWNSGGGDNRLVPFSQTFSVATADYVGVGLNQIHLRFRGTADSGWSDGDCRWPTYGHSNVDNIQVTTNNGVSTYDNFEGGPVHWAVAYPPAAGDFSHVWPRLADLDPCNGNNSPVVAFIDDGVVEPGTGGTPGVTWTYGPGGYIFNPSGGLAGPGYHVTNEIWSPALTWPGATYTGCNLRFDLYQHLPLDNGMFAVWHVRGSTDGGTTWSGWQDENLVYYSDDPLWSNLSWDVTPRLPGGRTHVQIALGAWDYGWVWGFHSSDVTPAPYFDNVRLVAYTFPGPAIAARDLDLFQDNFPAIGTIDRLNLGNNSIRLDMANNISQLSHNRNDPGDSIIVNVAVVRTGATLQGYPKMYYKLHPNHLFDAYRTSGLPLQGVINGDTTKTSAGAVITNSWRWDLPDSNFFFPGDAIHYFFEAQDNQGGNIGTTRMPSDTTGFSFFPGMPGYKPMVWEMSNITNQSGNFTIRGLPTMHSATAGDQPRMLFWNDTATYGEENEWYGALANLGYREGTDYDLYVTMAPSSGLGNGLGGRATGPQLSGYNTMLYSSGQLASVTLSNGDYSTGDGGNDIAVMTDWLSQGGKKWFACGDGLAFDLGASGAATLGFRNTFLPMIFEQDDVRPLIQNQINPTVNPVAGNPVGLTKSFIAYGGCPLYHKFDAVRATTGSVRIATFQQLSGSAYPYAAALYVPNAGGYNDQIVFMPYDLAYIYKTPNTAKGTPATLEKRAEVLREILTFFGQLPTSPATGIDDTPGLAFSAKNFPNPFNPSTKIEYSLPRDGQLSIKVYNVRGELVRTLVDQPTKAGPGSVTWLGDDDRGQKVASGVYFYQVKSASDEIFNKMTLVK